MSVPRLLEVLSILLPGLLANRVNAQVVVPYPPPGYAAGLVDEGPPDPEIVDVDEGATVSDRGSGFGGQLLLGGHHARLARGNASIRGTGVALSASLGFSVTPRLRILGVLAGATAVSPSVTGDEGADDLGLRGGAGTALTTLAAGGGVSWLAGGGLRIGASALLTQVRLVDRSSGWLISRSRPGPAIELGLGKHWALGEHMALGLELQARGFRLPDSGTDHRWSGLTLLLGGSLEID